MNDSVDNKSDDGGKDYKELFEKMKKKTRKTRGT